MKRNQADHPIATMCKTFNVSKSGYYDWLERPPSQRSQANVALTAQIKAAHTVSDATYGMPRIRAELTDLGITASRKRIAKLMRDNKLAGVSRRRAWCVTTTRNKRERPASDLVKRQFMAKDINQLWVADMTYIPTWQGFIYLAVVVDVFSRKVVGWSFGEQMTSDLVVAALNMALITRKPGVGNVSGQGVIHHSDQGSQYTSLAFGERCKAMNVRTSMGTVGDAYDNAMAESFFASLECELIDRRTWQTKTAARLEVFTWIEAWYNPNRRHSGIGYKSPINFEAKHKLEKNDRLDTQDKSLVTPEPAANHGLPTGCFAPVDKPPYAPDEGAAACPQASPVDKPELQVVSQ